jgi:hypothetical protein
MPIAARFAGSDRLIVVEDESGRLVAHSWAKEPNQNGSLFSTATNNIIGSQEERVTTLHHGNCVGYSIPRETYDIMPDGRKIVYEPSDIFHASDKNAIRVLGGQAPITLKLGNVKTRAEGCVQFSANWKEMLIVGSAGVSLYDFERALASAVLEGSEIGVIPVLNAQSAFFVPQPGDVVTSDGSNEVLLWKREMNGKRWRSTKLYRGENPIFYAEPDSNGGNLILLESIGEGDVHGRLYSVSSRQDWFDLGSDYKWLGAAFNDKQEVVVSMHSSWTGVFPMLPLNTLVELAKKELSAWCHPTKEGDYRSSPCWPSALD